MWNSKLSLNNFYDSTVWIRLQVKDMIANSSIVTSASFEVDNKRPEKVNLISPANNSYIKDTTPIFKWNKVTDIDIAYYEIAIDSNINNNGTSTNFTTVLSQAIHNWKVRAIDTNGNIGDWSSEWNLTIDTTAPNIVILQSPVSNSYIDETTATFQWYASADAISGISNYIIQVSTNKTFNVSVQQQETKNTSCVISGLRNEAMNWWRVRAYDRAANTNNWSSIWSVYIDTNAIIPTLYTPQNNSFIGTNNPVYVWSKEPGISRYWIAVLTNVSGIVVYSNTNVSAIVTNTQLGTLKDGIYGWRVRVYNTNKDAWDLWGGPNKFTVDTTAPGQVILSMPTNGTITTNKRPKFIWNSVTDVSGIDYYEMMIIGKQTNQLSVTNYTPGTDLSEGTNIWKVRSVDNVGNKGSWSSSWQVIIDTTAPGKIVLISPGNNEIKENNIPVEFKWNSVNDVSGIAKYEIEIDGIKKETQVTNYTVTGLGIGKHTWRVRAIDKAGYNGEWSALWTVNISEGYASNLDNARPWNTVIKPEENKVKFIELSKGTKIWIYTLKKQKVTEIEAKGKEEEWIIPDELTTGVYIVYMKDEKGATKKYKIVRVK